jgi:hypothetical protein
MKVLVAIALPAALACSLVAQTPEASPGTELTLPEIEAVRGPYLKSIIAIRSARDARVAGINRSYVANLERLQRDSTTIGDLKAALAVKTESERMAANKEPSEDERKEMPAKILAARRAYEQKRLTTQGQLEKALAIKKLIGSMGDEDRVEGLFGKWRAESGTIAISRDGTCLLNDGGDRGKWVIEGGFLEMHWGNGFFNRIPLSGPADKREAEQHPPGETKWLKWGTFVRVKK